MPTFNGTAANNLWVVTEPGSFIIDGMGGVDTIEFGTSQRSSYNIYTTPDGALHVDSISGASGDGALLKATLFNIEVLKFDSKRDVVDVIALFGDTTAPTVTISDDTSGTANGPVTYTLNFSEPVVGLAAASLNVSNGSVLAVSGGGAVWQAVVVPTNGASGAIAFALKGAGVVDGANNPNVETTAAAQPFDTQAPTLLSGNPSAGATGVAPGSNIVLTFNEAVVRGTGTITLRDAAGAVAESFDAASSTRLTLSGSSLTIDPSSDLAPGTSYSVVFANGSLRDGAGNGLAGTGVLPYSFSTAAATSPTALTGTNANDLFAPAATIKTIDGLGGIDTAQLSGSRSAYALSSSAGVVKVAAVDGSRNIDLSQVERLAFDNQRLAVDLDGNAGTVAKILGAVFGKSSVGNAEYVGIGLNLLDGGMSYQSLMQLALDARLGANASAGAVVDLLYTNVVGVAPSASDRSFYVGLLDNQTYTAASLGVLAADTDLNKVTVDLVGLAQSGLPYL